MTSGMNKSDHSDSAKPIISNQHVNMGMNQSQDDEVIITETDNEENKKGMNFFKSPSKRPDELITPGIILEDDDFTEDSISNIDTITKRNTLEMRTKSGSKLNDDHPKSKTQN